MIELFQTEWCPASGRVRERLTELGVDYLNRQVPVDADSRVALAERTGSDTVPALVLEDGSALVGELEIIEYLDERYRESREARAHRAKAALARRRYLQEECECSQPATH